MLSQTPFSRLDASVVTMLGGHAKNFCWGGGTAIRRDFFEQMDMPEVWQNSFSDDFSLTIAIERTGRRIVFLPECITPSYVQTDFSSLLEFTNRRLKSRAFIAQNVVSASQRIFSFVSLFSWASMSRSTSPSNPAVISGSSLSSYFLFFSRPFEAPCA